MAIIAPETVKDQNDGLLLIWSLRNEIYQLSPKNVGQISIFLMISF
jgi:hypothetical protein